MKTQIAFLILISGLTISCNTTINKTDLIGKWAGYENDTTYMEVWFNDSSFLTWRADRGSIEINSYRFNEKDNSITISVDNFETTDYNLKIEKLNDKELAIGNVKVTRAFTRLTQEPMKIKYDDKKIHDELAIRSMKAKR